ncbi:MAG: hypothetical protein FJ222_00940 [Lentisphaerae bacterium]|nr:hypothetical protein [Lentisphaerota bacterium]
MRHPLVEEWERRLDAILQEVDQELEARFGELYNLHPVRPANGATGNRQYDGLFRITANFTAGFGSEVGPGYVLTIGFSTLEPVSAADRATIEQEAITRLRARLPEAFPGRKLSLIRDGAVWKIAGDLSLDAAEDRA